MKTKFFLKEALNAVSAAMIVLLALLVFGPKIASVQAKIKTLKSIKAGGISNPYLGSNAVTGEKIAEGTIGSREIADGSITNADISGSAAIDYSKLNLGSNITSANITDGTIVNADISSAAAISSGKINFDTGVNITGGNVGIGTASPGAELQVVGGIKLWTDDSGTTNGFRVYNKGGTIRYGTLGWYGTNIRLQANDPYDVAILNAAGDGITVKDSTGYVGIGTTSPQSKLQVSSGYIQLDKKSGAPASADCDAAAEEGRLYWDATADNFYICSGASGWRKVTTVAP